jgi:general secretion pathway protein G
MRTERRFLQGGFTLVEIMVVVVILGLLATVVVQNVVGYSDEARTTKAGSDLNTIHSAMRLYLVKNGSLPNDGLEALTREDERGEAYIEQLPKDPWGNDYIFIPGERRKFIVLSMGPDKMQDTEDDIRYPPPDENER